MDRYCINFGDRVKESSIKNFQLKSTLNNDPKPSESEVFIELGKISKNKFSLNVKWPLSIANAFGIAISVFDTSVS